MSAGPRLSDERLRIERALIAIGLTGSMRDEVVRRANKMGVPKARISELARISRPTIDRIIDGEADGGERD